MISFSHIDDQETEEGYREEQGQTNSIHHCDISDCDQPRQTIIDDVLGTKVQVYIIMNVPTLSVLEAILTLTAKTLVKFLSAPKPELYTEVRHRPHNYLHEHCDDNLRADKKIPVRGVVAELPVHHETVSKTMLLATCVHDQYQDARIEEIGEEDALHNFFLSLRVSIVRNPIAEPSYQLFEHKVYSDNGHRDSIFYKKCHFSDVLIV